MLFYLGNSYGQVFNNGFTIIRSAMRFMKRIQVALVFVLLISCFPYSAQGATKPDLVIKGFQAYVSAAKSSLVSSKADYDSKVFVINSVYSSTISSAKATYDSQILSSMALYGPQILASKQAIKDAQAKLLTVNDVRVLNLGTFRNYWGNLDCPQERPNCKSLDDKGELFKVGEVTRLKAIMGTRADFLYEIQLMIDLGLIEMLYPNEYQVAAQTIRSEPDKIKTLTAKWEIADAEAADKKNKEVNAANLASYIQLSPLDKKLESDRVLFESQIKAGNLAIKAAKRAAKSATVFDKAFVTAYRFDYNVRWLDDLANLPISSLTSLRSILSQFEIIKLADQAAVVDSKYSYSAAGKINKSVGNVFIIEEEYKASAKLVAAQYKKMTKLNLKL